VNVLLELIEVGVKLTDNDIASVMFDMYWDSAKFCQLEFRSKTTL